MKQVLFFLLISISASIYADNNSTQLIEYSGATIEEPYWFKDSFLDIAEDINEAEEEGKHLLIYFHQAGCPYCYNLVQQSFLDPQFSEFIQKHFDVVALNLWGDREVTLLNGDLVSEKQLAIQWNVQFTPTLFFYKSGDEKPLRINGYRSKKDLAKIFDYVITGSEKASLAQSLINNSATDKLYPSNDFKQIDILYSDDQQKPVAVLFEYPGCLDCEQLHKQVLSRKDTHQLLSAYQVFRADLSSEHLITVDSETQLTAQQWADKLGLTYYPSVILYDENLKERFRIDGYVQRFHFHASLEYVSDKIYQRLPEFQRYINERADRLRQAGKNIKITE